MNPDQPPSPVPMGPKRPNVPPQRFLPAFFLFIMLGAGIIGLLRSGYLVSLWAVYGICGTETEAVIESSEEYRLLIRKPRPSRTIPQYRGTYALEVPAGDGAVRKLRGTFDTRKFIGVDTGRYAPGDKIPVVYLRQAPSCSRPGDEVKNLSGMIAMVFLLLSLALTGLSVFLLALRRNIADFSRAGSSGSFDETRMP